MGTRLYVVRRGKRKGVSKSKYDSPRTHANSLRVGVGSGDRGAYRAATGAERRRWKPKKGRRKVGARRKLTVLETIFRWVKVPTGKRRRSRAVRR